jgi:hypothetical protein
MMLVCSKKKIIKCPICTFLIYINYLSILFKIEVCIFNLILNKLETWYVCMRCDMGKSKKGHFNCDIHVYPHNVFESLPLM